MSLIKQYTINSGTMEHVITVTAQDTENDFNGNPNYLIQVWTSADNGHLWYPKLKGFRDRKNCAYKLQSYDLYRDLDAFVKQFEKHIRESVGVK